MRKFLVLHPILFAVFPLVFLYAHNATQMTLGVIVVPMVIVLGFTLCSYILLTLFIKDYLKRGLVLSLFLLLFFSYGHVVHALPDFRLSIGKIDLGPDVLVFPIWCVLQFIGTYLCIGTRRDLRVMTRWLNAIAAILVAVQVIRGAYALATRPEVGDIPQIAAVDAPPTSELPDIYYIIIDGYGRSDVLERIYNYDNSVFLDFLREHGFQVAEKGRANYCQTLLSLASTLNLDYLPRLATLDRRSKDRRPAHELLKNNRVFDFVKRSGYTLVAFASGYEYTEFADVDFYLTPGLTLSEFNNVLLTTTPIPFVLRWGKTQYDLHRNRINYMLAKLPYVQEGTSPRFIFAHLLGPHPPFVFGPNGEPVARQRLFNYSDGSYYYQEGGNYDEYIAGYSGQITHLTRRLQGMIETILSQAKESPPVIILQADHGPGSTLHWYDLTITDVQERFGILNAYLLPGADEDLIENGITPVNTFRLVFNQYFGTDFELLPNRTYYTTWSRPYHFFDVTNPDSLPDFPGDLQ